jgi:CRP-like cAMP-binding protein
LLSPCLKGKILPKFDHLSSKNILLHMMAEGDSALLAQHLEPTVLARRQKLTLANKPIEHVYFPEDGLASIVSELPQTGPTEIGIFGRDGMSGTAILMGAHYSPYETFMQVEGHSGWRIESARLLEAVAQSASLRDFLLRYVLTQIVQTGQNAISNAHHRMEARLARWLLMCHDRVFGDDIHITHEFMGMMIAAQRSGVTLTLHELEWQGMIRAQRGVVTVINREALEHAAGDAYGKPEAEYQRLIGPLPPSHNIFGPRAQS